MKPNFIYSHPLLYQAMLYAVHGKHLKQRYQTMVEELGDTKSVFEPLCGPALLPRYLPEGVNYSGFDINPKFVRYAQKKGHEVWEGDARDPQSFSNPNTHSSESKGADSIVLVDALHHVQPYMEQRKLIERCAESGAKSLLICEPFGDRYFETIQKMPFIEGLARWFYNWIERDGSNQVRFENIRTKSELEDLMSEGFGVKTLKEAPKKIQQIGPEDLLVTYHL